MSGIGRSGKMVHPDKTNDGDAGGEVCFFHVAIYDGPVLFNQFESGSTSGQPLSKRLQPVGPLPFQRHLL
jgi:hypothetical protein